MITLNKMNQTDFNLYIQKAIPEYAKDLAKASFISEESALSMSKSQFESMLNNGLETENNFLYTLKNNDEFIGTLWLILRSVGDTKSLFIGDIYINEDYQGKGFGKIIMSLIENKARELGAPYITLHVFGHNSRAVKFYESIGFFHTNHLMRKHISV